MFCAAYGYKVPDTDRGDQHHALSLIGRGIVIAARFFIAGFVL
ncbi:hypothetical protein BN2364_0826 [Alloalcanivorax xenomutans]|nr:hypothetical protein BN2364_0826 [Alloalcanivorax xenomutans]